MIETFKKRFPLVFLVLFFLIFFRKVIFGGLLPIPSDLLVSFYFPFSSGGFKEYSSWVPNKAQVADDSLRQQYPWKMFYATQIKKGELPLWNPYAFSGYPLTANVQTGTFYPLNLLFIFINPKIAWTILILIQPVLSVLFMYFFLRSQKLGQESSLLGGLGFAFMSFELFWMEQMIIGHTTLWLPLILLALQKMSEGKKKWFLVGIIATALSIFGGYSQTSLYVLLVSASFLLLKVALEKDRAKKTSLFVFGTLVFILALGLSAIQLFPTWEIYKFSAREGTFSESLYEKSLAPPRNILTLLSADFFGNMATHNYWGDQHTDFNHWFGCVPLMVTLTGLYLWYKKKIELGVGKWFLIMGLVAWIFSLQTPLGYFPMIFKIPILSTGVVARFLFIFQFCLVIVAAISLDKMIKNKDLKISLKPALLLFLLTALLTITYFFLSKYSLNVYVLKISKVTYRNLVFSSVTFGAGLFFLFLTKFGALRRYCFYGLIALTALEYLYLGNKYLPMAKKEYLFPEHPVFTYLQEKAGIDRFWGQAATYVTTNFPTVYSLHYSDGYDSLFMKRYGEFVYSARNGQIPASIPRSDVNLDPNKEEWKYKEKMLDLLSIKYILDKNDIPKENFEPELWKFPPERYELLWQDGKFKIYENKKAYPRIYFAEKIIVKNNNQEIINELLKKDYKEKIAVLEEEINPPPVESGGKIKLTVFSPNKMSMETVNEKSGFLVLTDNYYPGWYARIDGKQTKIYRTNYSFRGIIVPKGEHKVEFAYEPDSLKVGFIITLVFGFMTVLAVYVYGKNKNLS